MPQQASDGQVNHDGVSELETSKRLTTEGEEVEEDDFLRIRRNCEKHIRRLERYKKAKSFCTLENDVDDEQGNAGDKNSNQNALARNNSLGPGISLAMTHGLLQLPQSSTAAFQHEEDSLIVDSEECHHQHLTMRSANNTSNDTQHQREQEQPGPSSTCSSSTNAKKLKGDQEDQGEIETTANSTTHNQHSQFDALREKMISLMENDVQLLQKLLNLGDELRDMRQKQQQDAAKYRRHSHTQQLSRTSSEGSLLEHDDDGYDEENGRSRGSRPRRSMDQGEEEEGEQERRDEFRPLRGRQAAVVPFSRSMNAITRLYVDSGSERGGSGGCRSDDDEEDDEFDVDESGTQLLKPNVQYFSRKNSVLRIPIPPRASNRMVGKKLQVVQQSLRRTPRPFPSRSDTFITQQQSQSQPSPAALIPNVVPNAVPGEDSGHSSAASVDTPPQQHSPPPSSSSCATRQEISSRIEDLEVRMTADPIMAGIPCDHTENASSMPSSRYSTFSSVSSTSTADSAIGYSTTATSPVSSIANIKAKPKQTTKGPLMLAFS